MSEQTKIRIAEEMLFALAAELRFVPVEERSRSLHLRALELKRRVRTWSELEVAPLDGIDDAIREIESLTTEARRHRKRSSNVTSRFRSRGLTASDRGLSIAQSRTSQATSDSHPNTRLVV